MGVKDRNILPDAKVALECITFVLGSTSTGQTDAEMDSVVPAYAFEVERVEVYATAVTATASVDVLIGSTSVLSADITPVAGTATAGTLSSTIDNVRGTASEALNVTYTTNGTGVITNGRVRVWIRPQHMNGEA